MRIVFFQASALVLPAVFFFVFCAGGFAEDARPDVVVADFEGDDFGDWNVEGSAFGAGPARGRVDAQGDVFGFEGKGLANSCHGGDVASGVLTSPEIELTRPFVNFLIGGGGVEGLRVELVVAGEVARVATGPNTVPGGSESLDWVSWDVTELVGQKARIRVVDDAVGGWGHLSVDQIMLSDRKLEGVEHTRELEIVARYLLIPVKPMRTQNWVRVEVDGEVVREFAAPLTRATDEKEPFDFNACLDLELWIGKKCRFIVERAEQTEEFAPLTFSDKLYGGARSYDEKYRPRLHFSPRYGWMNDPNGLTFYNGRYHLFYQHNPFSVNGGNQTWGHATSRDLVHWVEEGDVLYPDRLGTIYSGSGAVDFRNTTGFQTDPDGPPPFVVMFTCNGMDMRYGASITQNLAYSLDDGRTFTKYGGNPTLPHFIGGNRDPRIFWHEPTRKWVVALYLDGEDYALFGSSDLKSWDLLCKIEKLGCSECPDMFELPVDGDENNKLWVFWGGNGKYLLGNFDGTTFEKTSEPLDAKWGGNDYAAQTFSDTPGRRVQLSWMNWGGYPFMPFNQQFTVPRELTLRTTPEGIRLFVFPVKEFETLRNEAVSLAILESGNVKTFVPKESDPKDFNLLDYEIVLEPKDGVVVVEARGRRIELDPDSGTMKHEGIVAPLAVVDGKIKLRLALDLTSFEIFANDGLSQIARCFVFQEGNPAPILRVENARTVDVRVWTMADIWK